MTTYCQDCGRQKLGPKCSCEFRLIDKAKIKELTDEFKRCQDAFADIWKKLAGTPSEDAIAEAYAYAEGGQEIAYDAALKTLELLK